MRVSENVFGMNFKVFLGTEDSIAILSTFSLLGISEISLLEVDIRALGYEELGLIFYLNEMLLF